MGATIMGVQIDWKSFRKKRSKLVNGFPVGMVLFTGKQGSGKSLSQSRYTYLLQEKFGCKVYSATDYKLATELIDESDISKRILTKREDKPTVFLLDEIQVLLDRDSTDKVTKSEVRKAIQQQRKRNTSIVGTVQELLDLDTVYRRQLAYVVRCSHFGAIQIERWLDGASLKFDSELNKYTGTTSHIKIWKRNNEIFNLYDTFEIVGEKQGVAPG